MRDRGSHAPPPPADGADRSGVARLLENPALSAIHVRVQGLVKGVAFDVVISRDGETETLGTITIAGDRGDGDDDDDDDGKDNDGDDDGDDGDDNGSERTRTGNGNLVINTKRGGALPFGASSVAELVGSTVNVLNPAGDIMLTGTIGELDKVIGDCDVEGTAELRVAHLSPDAPNVDIWLDGEVVLADVAFGAVSDYLVVAAGQHTVQVTPAGAAEPVVIDATLELAADTSTTVAATGLLGENDLQPLVLLDDREPEPAAAKVRFVHASPDAPAVDIAVTGGPVVFADFEFREASEYLTLEPATLDLEVRLAGTEDVVCASRRRRHGGGRGGRRHGDRPRREPPPRCAVSER